MTNENTATSDDKQRCPHGCKYARWGHSAGCPIGATFPPIYAKHDQQTCPECVACFTEASVLGGEEHR